jgi:uncharacterized membrane protein YbhN (UPF0104 family)
VSRWLVRAAISAVVVAVLLAVIPLESVFDAIGRISLRTWVVSLTIFFAGHYLNALKLRLLVGGASPPVPMFLRAQYAGLAANLSLPGVAGGDLVRAAYLAPAVGTKTVAVASVADRAIDTLSLVGIVLAAVPFAGVPLALIGPAERVIWWAIVLGIVVSSIGVVLVVRSPRWVAGPIDRAWRGVRDRRGSLAMAAAISVGVQSAFVMTNVWLASEAGVRVGLAPWFVAWPASKLIAILPISLGGLGVREAALVWLLVPYGAPAEAVLATGILWQAVLIVSGLTGLLVTHTFRAPPSPAAR